MGKSLVIHGDVSDIREDVDNLREIIIEYARDEEDLPTSVILDAVPFNPLGSTIIDALKEWSDIQIERVGETNKYEFTTEGEYLSGDFNDDNFGRITVEFDESISGTLTVFEDSFIASLTSPTKVSLHDADDIPPALRPKVNQYLSAFRATKRHWEYWFNADAEQDDLTMFADLYDYVAEDK